MKLAMVLPAEGHRVFVADLSAQGPRLGETEMVRIGRTGAAKKTGLRGDIAEMGLVAKPPGFTKRQDALVDTGSNSEAQRSGRGFLSMGLAR